MVLKNCAKCKKIFSYSKNPICPECQIKEDEIFNNVKDYISENEKSSIEEISEATGVSEKKILKYIKDGRLEMSRGIEGSLHCESCGVSINKGRYCVKCANKIGMKIKNDMEKISKSSNLKKTNVMYTRIDDEKK